MYVFLEIKNRRTEFDYTLEESLFDVARMMNNTSGSHDIGSFITISNKLSIYGWFWNVYTYSDTEYLVFKLNRKDLIKELRRTDSNFGKIEDFIINLMREHKISCILD